MTDFTVYNFHLGTAAQGSSSFDPDDVMTRRNEIFESLFADFGTLSVYPDLEMSVPLPIEAVHNREIIMFYLGDPGTETGTSNCMVIIDNRRDMECILIQRKRSAFNGNTDKIAEMLQRSFNLRLSHEHLRIHIPFPAQPRVAEAIDKVDDVFGKMNRSMMIRTDAAEDGILTGLDVSDPRLQFFLAANAKSGKLDMTAGLKTYYDYGNKLHRTRSIDDRIATMTARDFEGGVSSDTYSYVIQQINDPTACAKTAP